MKFVSRSAWGARYGRGNTAITPGRGGVTVHYEGGGKLTGHPHSACDDRVRNIESYHVDHNGWAGIAYTALVCEHGYVYEGRGLGHRTAANGTNAGNQNWYAVCALIGDDDIPGHDLKAGLLDAIGWCRSSGGAADRVNGHRDHLSTSCPGDRLYAWVQAGLPTEIEEDDMLGLKKGDTGERVKLLQLMIQAAGQKLPKFGVDGDYGAETAEALRLVRVSAGSAAARDKRDDTAKGNRVDPWALQQLHTAVARNQGGQALRKVGA